MPSSVPPPPPKRILRTVCICLVFMSMGAQQILGPTIPDLELKFNTDTKTLGLTYMGNKIGFLVGVFLSAPIADRVNQDLLIGAVGSVGAIALGVAPLMGTVIYFSLAYGIAGIANGFCNAVAESYIISLWLRTKLKDPLTQMAHLGWSMGATLCPVFIQPFLSRNLGIRSAKQSGTETLNSTSSPYHVPQDENMSYNLTQLMNNINITADDLSNTDTNVQMCYLAVGVFVLATSLLAVLIFLISGPTWRPLLFLKKPEPSVREKTQESSNASTCALTTVITLLFALYVGEELTYGSLVTPFVVKGLDWHSRKRTLITTAYFGAFGVGQLIAMALSFVCRPRTIIMMCMFIINASLVTLLFTLHMDEASIWTCTIIKGLCNGPMLATLFLWTSRIIFVSGFVSSVLYIGGTLGVITIPAFSAFVMQTYGYKTFLYISLGLSVATFLLFLILEVFVKKKCLKHLNIGETNVELEQPKSSQSLLQQARVKDELSS